LKAKENQKVPLTKIFLAASFLGSSVVFATRGEAEKSGRDGERERERADCEHSLKNPRAINHSHILKYIHTYIYIRT